MFQQVSNRCDDYSTHILIGHLPVWSLPIWHHFPHDNAITPCITGRWEFPVWDGLRSRPSDGDLATLFTHTHTKVSAYIKYILKPKGKNSSSNIRTLTCVHKWFSNPKKNFCIYHLKFPSHLTYPFTSLLWILTHNLVEQKARLETINTAFPSQNNLNTNQEMEVTVGSDRFTEHRLFSTRLVEV